jgi:hypothetical protein
MTNENAIKIQRAFRHHRNGRKEREYISLKYYSKIRGFKRFQIVRFFDKPVYLYTKNNRETVIRIMKSLDEWIYQDEDDPHDYSLTNDQMKLIEEVLSKEYIKRKDIVRILNSLDVKQFNFLQ